MNHHPHNSKRSTILSSLAHVKDAIDSGDRFGVSADLIDLAQLLDVPAADQFPVLGGVDAIEFADDVHTYLTHNLPHLINAVVGLPMPSGFWERTSEMVGRLQRLMLEYDEVNRS